MKEAWLFEKLDTLGENDRDRQRNKELEENVQKVKGMVRSVMKAGMAVSRVRRNPPNLVGAANGSRVYRIIDWFLGFRRCGVQNRALGGFLY